MNKFARVSTASLATLMASGAALAQTAPTTGVEAFEQAATASVGYGPLMFALAAGSVGIMIAVKWIKRARGAA